VRTEERPSAGSIHRPAIRKSSPARSNHPPAEPGLARREPHHRPPGRDQEEGGTRGKPGFPRDSEAPRRGLRVSRPVSRILSRVTIPLCSNPGPRRAAYGRALFALHRTGFSEPPCRHDAGGLLPHLFTLTFGISGELPLAVSFLFHFPSAFAAWVSPASCPAVSGLSSSS